MCFRHQWHQGGQLSGASVLAADYDAVTGDRWQRTGRRSNGARFTVLTLGHYCLHDLTHHLHDVSAPEGTG